MVNHHGQRRRCDDIHKLVGPEYQTAMSSDVCKRLMSKAGR